MRRWMWIAAVWTVGCATAPALETPAAPVGARAGAPVSAPTSAPESASGAQGEAARAMAQQVCGSPHVDAALTALGTRAAELVGLPEEAPELLLPELAAAQCLRDMAHTDMPADAVPGPPIAPSVAALVCACRTPRCQVWAARQVATDAPTAEARQEAVLCLRGGLRAVLAAQAMEQAVCACQDLACGQKAGSEKGAILLQFKHLRGSERDIAAIKAAGEAMAACMQALAVRALTSGKTNQNGQRRARPGKRSQTQPVVKAAE